MSKGKNEGRGILGVLRRLIGAGEQNMPEEKGPTRDTKRRSGSSGGLFARLSRSSVEAERENRPPMPQGRPSSVNKEQKQASTVIPRKIDVDYSRGEDDFLEKLSASFEYGMSWKTYLATKDHNGDTELHKAIKNGRYDIATRLLKLGADPRIANNNGETPLALGENSEISKAMVEKAAFLDKEAPATRSEDQEPNPGKAPDQVGVKSPKDPARRKAVILPKGKAYDLAERNLVKEFTTEKVEAKGPLGKKNAARRQAFEEKKAQIKQQASDPGQSSKLLADIREKRQKEVREIVSKEIKDDMKDENGQTALHRYVSTNKPLLVKIAIELGANPNVQDNQGKTALDIAKEKGNPRIQSLLNKGAVSSIKDDKKPVQPLKPKVTGTAPSGEPSANQSAKGSELPAHLKNKPLPPLKPKVAGTAPSGEPRADQIVSASEKGAGDLKKTAVVNTDEEDAYAHLDDQAFAEINEGLKKTDDEYLKELEEKKKAKIDVKVDADSKRASSEIKRPDKPLPPTKPKQRDDSKLESSPNATVAEKKAEKPAVVKKTLAERRAEKGLSPLPEASRQPKKSAKNPNTSAAVEALKRSSSALKDKDDSTQKVLTGRISKSNS